GEVRRGSHAQADGGTVSQAAARPRDRQGAGASGRRSGGRDREGRRTGRGDGRRVERGGGAGGKAADGEIHGAVEAVDAAEVDGVGGAVALDHRLRRWRRGNREVVDDEADAGGVHLAAAGAFNNEGRAAGWRRTRCRHGQGRIARTVDRGGAERRRRACRQAGDGEADRIVEAIDGTGGDRVGHAAARGRGTR